MMDTLSALQKITTSIKDWVNERLKGKVDAVDDKGLSTNDLTDALVDKINAADQGVKDVGKLVGTLPEDAGATTVVDYIVEKAAELSQNSGSIARIGYATLLADAWKGEEGLYAQIVSIDGTTPNTQVDLTPSVEQLAVFYNKDLAFVTENANGVVTVYAIGQKPQNDYTIQVTMTEVVR